MRHAFLAVVLPLVGAVLAAVTQPPLNPLMPTTGCAIGPREATAGGFVWLAIAGLSWLWLRHHPRKQTRR